MFLPKVSKYCSYLEVGDPASRKIYALKYMKYMHYLFRSKWINALVQPCDLETRVQVVKCIKMITIQSILFSYNFNILWYLQMNLEKLHRGQRSKDLTFFVLFLQFLSNQSIMMERLCFSKPEPKLFNRHTFSVLMIQWHHLHSSVN